MLAACALAWAAVPARAGPSDAGAQARDGGTSQGAPIEAAPVEIVADRPEGPQRAPAAQSSVIETARFAGEVRSVAELLSTSPGVSVHALGGPGQTSTVSLRGAAADQSLVLLDGVPLAGPGGGAVDLGTLPLGLFEKVVVSRGVLGAQMGSGALGGVIELVPRQPRAERLQGGAQLSAGSFGTAQLAGDLTGAAGESSSWLAAVQLDRTSGDFDYQRKLTPELPDAPLYDETRVNADAQRAAGLLRWTSRLSGTTEASVLAQASGGRRGLPGPIGGFTPHARGDDASWAAGARVQGLAGEAIWTARTWARGSWLELHGMRVYGDCVEGPGCPPTFGRSVGTRAEGELRAPIGASQWVDVLLSGGGERASGDGVGVRERGVGAAALSDDVRLLDGRLSIHPAVRVEAVGPDWGVSPSVAAMWRPWAEGTALAPVSLRAGAGRSFRAPTLAELYLDQGAVVNNPDLKPEHAWSVDAGASWSTDALTLSAGAFWSRYQDLILYEQNPPARIKPFNIGAARIAGVELGARVALPLGFSAEASYAFLDAINLRPSETEGGQKLAYRAPHHLFVRGAHRSDRLEGYAELDATSSMPRNQFGTASLPGRVLINVGAGVRAVGPLWLDLEVKNLLDDRTQQDLFQYPLPGISFAAIARARL